MSEQATAYLEQLVANEVSYKITSLILTALLLAAIFAFWVISAYKDKKTAELRKEWFATLTEEQRKAIREQKNLNL